MNNSILYAICFMLLLSCGSKEKIPDNIVLGFSNNNDITINSPDSLIGLWFDKPTDLYYICDKEKMINNDTVFIMCSILHKGENPCIIDTLVNGKNIKE